MVPSPTTLTRKPVLPSVRYSIFPPPPAIRRLSRRSILNQPSSFPQIHAQLQQPGESYNFFPTDNDFNEKEALYGFPSSRVGGLFSGQCLARLGPARSDIQRAGQHGEARRAERCQDRLRLEGSAPGRYGEYRQSDRQDLRLFFEPSDQDSDA